jgi:hypothetical protein
VFLVFFSLELFFRTIFCTIFRTILSW